MARKVIVIIALLFGLLLSSCAMPERIDIEKIQNILVVGIDAVGDQVKLTMLVDEVTAAGSAKEEQHSTRVYVATGKTIFDAKSKLGAFGDKHAVWLHLHYIVLGEETARRGADAYLDFFYRNHENHLSDTIVVAQGMTASAFITNTDRADAMLSEQLNQLFEEAKFLSHSKKTMILDFMQCMKSKGSDPIMGSVGIGEFMVSDIHNKEEGQEKKQAILLGYALFREDKLVGYAGQQESRGINWMLGEVTSAPLIVETQTGAKVSLEVIKTNTDMSVCYEDRTVTVKITLETHLAEHMGNDKILNKENMQYLTQAQNALVREEVESAMGLIQKRNCDAVAIGELLHREDPQTWLEVENEWQDIFRELKLVVEIESNIQRSYNVIESMDA